MRAEASRETAELLMGSGRLSALFESHDWSQTSLGAVETWSDDLKTAVQIFLTELDRRQPTENPALDAESQNGSVATIDQAAQLDAFRVRLTDALRPLVDASDIQETAARILGEALSATRVIYIEVGFDSGEVIVHGNYTNGVAPLSGRYRLEDYHRNLSADHRAGHTQVVCDIPGSAAYTEAEKAKYREIDIAAHIDVPLIKNHQFVALLAVHQATPRQWTDIEIQQAEETAERTWAAVERARAEAALRESEAKYRMLFEAIDEGFCRVEVLYNETGQPVDHRILDANPAFERQTGLTRPQGRLASDLMPGTEPVWNDLYARVVATGDSEQLEQYSPVFDRWFEVEASCLGDPSLHQVAVIFRDISERKRSEALLQASHDTFLHLVENSPFGVYVVDADFRIAQMSAGAQKAFENVRPLIGRDFAEAMHVLWPEPFASEAIARFRHTLETGEPYRAPSLVECRRDVGEVEAYDWEIERITLPDGQFGVVCHFYDLSERQRYETALRQSEERYRTLFKSMDEGFCVIELLFDENSQPVDYRFLETNPAFERQSGLFNAQGRCMRELSPDHEEYWFEIYGNVALTGEARRFENHAAALNRWYNIYAFRIGLGDERKVAVLFNDITARKRREANAAFLAEISEDFSRLSTADEIMQTVGAKIGDYLKVTTCDFTDVDDVNGELTVYYGWSSPDVPSTVGTFQISQYLSEEFVRASRAGETVVVCNTQTDPRTDAAGYAAFNMYSFVTVPFHRQGRWTHYIAICDSRPRDWRVDEIQLIEEISNHIFPRLERARTEEALRESEEKYRKILTCMDEAFFVAEMLFNEAGEAIDYRYLEANPAFYTHAHLSENVVGRTMGEVVGGQPIPWLADYGRVVKTRQATRFEYDVEIEEVRGYYDVHILPLDEPNEQCVAVLFQNISERKQTEAAIAADLRDTQRLRDLSARLATEDNIQALYQEIMATAIALTNADAGTVQILDETTPELVLLATQGFGQKMTDHFYRVSAGSRTPCGIALRNGVRSFVDFDIPASEDPDGSLRLHFEAGLRSAQSTPLISRLGRPIGMVSTHWRTHHRPSDRELRFLDLLARQAADLIEQRQDAVQRKQLLEREQAARQEAERANRIKDEFLAVLSHELRSPLNPILGWTCLLQTANLDEARQVEALKTIERNARLQSQLIEDLLDISRIMQGKLSLTVATVDLSFVVAAAVETVRLAAEAKQIQITLDLDSADFAILGDAARLQQVVWNLLTNAVKFTSTGGQVTVELRQVGQLAQIRVIDTGIGISPQFLPHVFEYFRQADGSTTRKFGGLGLGLAIVRQIVEMHGGTVQAESQGEGQGATFVVQLPVMLQTAPMPSEPPNNLIDTEAPLAGLEILLVDDEPDTREFQAFLLEQSGAKVTAVASGFAALQALEQSGADVLVSDIGMPELDGYRLLQQIRLRPPDQGGTIPAIALTAYAAEIDQQRALQVGFQAHLTKPIEPINLVQTIARVLNRRS